MKVLVVDDEPSKAEQIKLSVDSFLDGAQRSVTTIVGTLTDAVRMLAITTYDLVVVDLMLPYLKDGEAASQAGLELVRQLRSQNGPNKAASVIGISAYPDEVAAVRDKFEEYGVLIVKFDDSGAWARALQRVLQNVGDRTPVQIDVDFVVICALEEEREGFKTTAFEKVSEGIVSGLNVHYVRFKGARELLGVVLRPAQMGLVAATVTATTALGVYRTKILCMSGICAGFSSKASLGQLVVASPAWEYQAGKWSTDGFEIAPMQVPLKPPTRNAIDQLITSDSFLRYVEGGIGQGQKRPETQVKPVLAPFATGSAVIADKDRLKPIQKQHRQVAALDMETFGLYFSAHEFYGELEHYFSVKCVVDFADVQKNDNLHHYGSVTSARAAEQIIRCLLGGA